MIKAFALLFYFGQFLMVVSIFCSITVSILVPLSLIFHGFHMPLSILCNYQRTEVYEYAKVLGNSQYILLPFQPYKLIYAYMLAEVGKVSDSLR